MVTPMRRARAALIEEFNRLHRMVLNAVRGDPLCRRWISIPAALAFKAGVDVPHRFAKSKSVGAHFALTPRRFSSGELDYTGRISKCGDAMVRSALYEATNALLTRCTR